MATAKPPAWPLLALMLSVVAGLWLLAAELRQPALPDSVIILATAELSTDREEEPQRMEEPQREEEPQQVELPHRWNPDPLPRHQADYRLRVDLPEAPDSPWALLLTSASMNVELSMNGTPLGDGGSMPSPVARNWNRPLYFTLPPGLLQAGENRLDLTLVSEPASDGHLPLLYLGPAEDLKPVYRRQTLLRHSLSQLVVVLLLVVATVMVILWGLRRQDTLYGWYALACTVWAMHNLNLVVVDIPLPTRHWDWLNIASLVWLPVAATLFIRRFLGLRGPLFERGLLAFGLGLPLLLALVPEHSFYATASGWAISLALLLGIYPVALLWRYYWRSRHNEVLCLGLAGLLMVLLGGHDFLLVNRYLTHTGGFLMHYSAPPVIFLFAWILLRRFASALTEAESLNQTLEQRIDEKHRELEDNYARLQAMERDRVLSHERERLTRDMHDGMGGHLMSLMAQVDTGTTDGASLRQGLQEALDDLRLMIDSLDDVGGDLPSVLGMVRPRIEPRLERAGIKLHWQVRDLPPLADLGPEKALHILRILQEAVTNTLRHANAANLYLETGVAPGPDGTQGVFVSLRDDGIGLAPDSQAVGRGLGNMTRRGQLVGGELVLANANPGTCVRLWLPLISKPLS